MLNMYLNSYHTNIKSILEENPRKFLDTEIFRKNKTILTQVFTKLTKFQRRKRRIDNTEMAIWWNKISSY